LTLGSGTKLGTYEILAPIGAGAMGEVYRAKDSRLGREVAIKVLPEHFADDEERLRRFEREAKMLATLNHPNVAQIFGVDQIGDTCFLVLELVPGENLDERLKKGPPSIEDALDICKQIAEGLEAAHEAGVIHRDLKPANVRLTPEGKVKLLDFGLAKPANEGQHGSSTDSVLSTEAGRLLGTPTYMAPEQARGKAIDKRVDIWAFGCVMYECFTGQRAFDGETLTDVLTTVLHKEIDIATLPAAVPPRVRELLARCLAKDPRRRLRDIGEARLVLEQPGADVAAAQAGASSAALFVPWAACALLAAALAFTILRKGGANSAGLAIQVRTAVRLPAGARLDLETNIGETTLLAISPDGTKLAFVASDGLAHKLYLRSLDSFDLYAVPDSEDATSPFFSPDSRWLAFLARGRLYKVAVAGGTPVDLCEAEGGRGGAWGPDGTIVFPAGIATGLVRISSSGGRAVALTQLDSSRKERTHRWPAFLPGGKEVAYTVGVEGHSDVYDDCEVDAVSLATGKTRHLGIHSSYVRATGNGTLLFARQGRISSVPLAELGGASAPDSQLVLQGVAGIASSGAVHYDVSNNGTLIYAAADPHAGEGDLAWVSREGKVERLSLPPRRYALPRVSPDGTKVAFSVESPQRTEHDVWVLDLRLGSMANLSSDGLSYDAVWSPDGKSVTYQFKDSSHTSLVRRPVDGRGPAEVLLERAKLTDDGPLCWTPDGTQLVCATDSGPPNSADLFVLTAADKQTRMLLSTTAIEFEASLSPDGKWLAPCSFDSGRSSIWVQSWPEGGARWPITENGALPCWSRDGKELFFVDGQNMMAVPVTLQPSFSAGAPVKLFTLEFPTSFNTSRNWDVAPDGRFIVVLRTSKETMADHIEVVQNWLGELR
jgi:serine/threonine-protein kinase